MMPEKQRVGSIIQSIAWCLTAEGALTTKRAKYGWIKSERLEGAWLFNDLK